MEITIKRARTRYKIKRTSVEYRVSVNKTNQYFSGQAIEMKTGKVIGSVHEKTFVRENKLEKTKPVEVAAQMGEALGKMIQEKKVSKIAFDRSGYIYHGKVKAFADGLRKSGLTL